MTTAILAPDLVFRATGNDGAPLAFGQLFTYASGTSNKQATYIDSNGVTPNPNPVILNVRGEANVWLDPDLSYKFVLAYSTDSDPPSNPIWTVDNVQGPLSVVGNLIPASDNLFTLGSPQSSFANLYLGPNHAPILDITSGNVGYFARTSAEITAGAIPTDYSWPADPYVDPRRYGADPTGATLSTTALQTALNVAGIANGWMLIGECNFLTGALTVAYNKNQFTGGLRISGSSQNGSRLTVSGVPTALLTVTGAGGPSAFPLVIENLSLTGASVGAINTIGISINQIAGYVISKVTISGFAYAVKSVSCLTCTYEDSSFINNGISGTVNGLDIKGPITPNLIRVNRCVLDGWGGWAIDFDQGSELQVTSCDLESNGTPSNNNTGAIHIGPALETGFGFGKVLLRDNWFEGNNGWTIKCDAPTNSSINWITINGGWIINSSGNSILVSGCAYLEISDFADTTIGATVSLTATYAALRNFGCSILTDTAITYPTYENVVTSTSGSTDVNGRRDNFTATLQTVSGSPTGNIQITQQGNEVIMDVLGPITGTSIGTVASLTGLPAKYWPIADTTGVLVLEDNGVTTVRQCTVAASNGLITLSPGTNFAGSGTKGVLGGQMRWRRT